MESVENVKFPPVKIVRYTVYANNLTMMLFAISWYSKLTYFR